MKPADSRGPTPFGADQEDGDHSVASGDHAFGPPFFRRLVEDVGVGVAVYDATGQFVWVNDAYADLFGVEPAAIEGVGIWDVIPAFDADRFEDYWDSFADGDTRNEETVHAFDGTTVPVETVTTRREIQGTTYHFGTILDITERREREAELKRENRRLQEFANHLSHDLRNPLTVAQGRVEFAREECESEHLAHVDQALHRMEGLIEDVLLLARGGERVAEFEAVELGAAARTAWSTVETAAATLTIDTEVTIAADEGRLGRILENCFRNAVEHGGSDVTVTVGRLDDGFFIADDGPGIPPDERERVFEAGVSETPDGTGFGLRIVQEVADAHDWDVSVTASAAGGARFEFRNVEIVDGD